MAAGYRGRSGQEYIYGNTVRAAESAEADYRRRQKKAAELERQTARYQRMNRRVRRNQEKALQMDAPYVMALTLAAIITLAICMQYLALRSSITSRLGNIEKLEREVEALRAENDALETSINTYVDLDYIYDVATKELGMVYANKDQILLYDKTESEYVRQYEDVPEH